MTTRASDVARTYETGPVNSLPVIAADIIYQGSAVGDDGTGNARPLVAGDSFRGFARFRADNASGLVGAVRVDLNTRGWIRLAIAGLALTDVGKDVFASDDDTFTLTQGGNTRIGYVYRFESTGYGIVRYCENEGTIAELTDSSGGTASNTIVDVPASYTEATLANQIASLVAKVNALIRRVGG